MMPPLHVLSGLTLGTKALFARWSEEVEIEDAVRQFHLHGATYFVMWTGDDGTFYGMARVSTVVS